MLVAAVGGLAGCSAGPVHVTPPQPESTAAGACTELMRRLPPAIEEGSARTIEPVSPFVTAWAEPAIVLRCGVPMPREYEATSELVTVNDVDWLPVQTSAGYSFYATGRVAWVRVDVPAAYAPETFALTEISDVVVTLAPGAAAD